MDQLRYRTCQKGGEPDSFEIIPGKPNLWAAKLIKSKTKAATTVTPFTGMPPSKDQLNDMRGDFLVGEFWNEGENIETKVNLQTGNQQKEGKTDACAHSISQYRNFKADTLYAQQRVSNN